ncbi:MAG TPA: hypothetical protein VGG75_41340 [Trebonia sp.]|jgi:hypothetical protein
MEHAPGDPRTLTEIESRLAESDPALAAMFDGFAARLSADLDSARKPVSSAVPRRACAEWIAVMVVLVACLCVSVAMAALTAS